MKHNLALMISLISVFPVCAQDAPLPPRVAAMKMTLPAGFKATLFAGEPDVVQPIAFCFDDRGRLWVAECLSYPNWQSDPKKGKDRILIFEEGDNGTFSKRTVFADNIQNISGIQYGFGGIWVCSTPNLLFIPIKEVPVGQAFLPADAPKDKEADKNVRPTKTVPAGPPEIVLDGWSLQASHNVFNSLTWGPDGWLYGCNGILATSRVGRPGTPDKDRVPINCGVWRYHPTKKKFEAVAHGTTNPWGLDFDEHGEMFITNCVIDHLWHIVPGGHYQRMFGEDLNPHVYKLMPSICDHLHWGGGNWTTSRSPGNDKRAGSVSDGYKVHSEAGGGHAHVGCMIYLGDNWPDRYRGGVFMCNLHGNRINHDILERNGSTYVARHAKDFMLANDPWFRGIALHYGPDGGVYVSDWTDTGECHNYKTVDRTNGRIFKITYGDVKPWKGDLAKLSDLELAKLQFHKNQWQARHARRLLQERAETREIDSKATALIERYFEHNRVTGKMIGTYEDPRYEINTANDLCSLWGLHAAKHLSKAKLLKIIDGPKGVQEEQQKGKQQEHERAWAVRLLVDNEWLDNEVLEKLLKLADRDSSPFLRLHLAGAVQRTSAFAKGLVSARLARHSEDAKDPYLGMMYWYLICNGLAGQDLASRPGLSTLGSLDSSIPLVRELAARRYTLARTETKQAMGEFEWLFWEMARRDGTTFQRDLLRGIQDGLVGQRNVPMPKTWKDAYPILAASPLPEVRERTIALAVQFGDERAFTLLRKIVPDRALPVKEREAALKTLLFQQKPDLTPILHDLLSDEALRGPAIRGLAAFDDAETPKLLVKHYAKWNADQKADAIQTLSSRGNYALALLDAIDAKTIPRGDINSYTIRQLQSLKAPGVAEKLAKVWGEVRPASADKAKLMAKYKAELKPDVLKKANLANGRALYAKSCANCHRLFGEGGDIGPDLTGSQRTNLDYILENVLDPNAIVPKEYLVTVISTKSGRSLSGIIKKESDAAITVQLPNEVVVVPKDDIDTRTPTKVSMMPEGIFEEMRLEEVRDLVAYLASPMQVPLKK
jgi:putative membrane-bound dehydrogenase-like protein